MKTKFALFATSLLSAAAALLIQRIIQFPPSGMFSSSEKKAKLRPIGEFEPNFAVAMSEQILFRESGVALIKEILKARGRIYLFTTQTLQDQVEDFLQQKKPFAPDELDGITKIQLEHESFWVRDFFPQPIFRTYPALPPTPSFVDFVYRDGNSFDDAAIHQFALAINSSVEHLPLVLDGGNFMTDGESCLLSEELAADPEAPQFGAGTTDLGQHIGDILREAMGCQKTLIVSQVPHPHVDMWLKFTKKRTLVVNEIQDRAMELISKLEPDAQERIKKIKDALDQTAARLEDSFRVVRIPMPLPVHDIFFTYANSVIVNDTVIIPQYKDPDPNRGSYPDKELYASYEEEVRKTFQELGFSVVLINSDDLIKEGGSFHCVTFHLPDLDAIVKETGQLAKSLKN